MARAVVIRELADRIETVRRPHPVRVAIDGVDAAGKTTLADELAAVLRGRGREVIRASIDGFHRPRAERYRRGELSPEGYYHDSFDYNAVREAILGPGGVQAPLNSILLFDGIFLLRPELTEHWDLFGSREGSGAPLPAPVPAGAAALLRGGAARRGGRRGGRERRSGEA